MNRVDMNTHDAKPTRFLVADIGGTNTRIGLSNGSLVDQSTVRRFSNATVPSLDHLLRQFLTACDAPTFDACCVAIAGPVQDDRAHMTNLDWVVDKAAITTATGAKTVGLLNDLEALGYAIESLKPKDRTFLIGPNGDAPAVGPRLVAGVGTGFNAAVVHRVGQGALWVSPSESGHMRLPVFDDETLGLAKFVGQLPDYCATEDVLSGRGLESVYRWAAKENGQSHLKSAAEICAAVSAGDDAVADRAVHLFVGILGNAIGDMALSHLPFGGIYLAGGVARNLAPHFERFDFAKAFTAKGRKSEFMTRFSVCLIEDDFTALNGCARYLDRLTG